MRSETEKQTIITVLGPQGSGKGTQSKKLVKNMGMPHISTGDLLRAEKQKDTEMAKEIRSLIDNGKFVPDEMIHKMVRERLSQPDCAKGAILDGYPRNIEQAEVFEKNWPQSSDPESCDEAGGARPGGVTKAILIDISDEEVMERTTKRRSCPKCGEIYHLKFKPPKNGEVCDKCDVELVWRDDDKEEKIKIRLQAYHEQTEPLVLYYRNKGVLVEVDGVGTIEEVYERIKSGVGK